MGGDTDQLLHDKITEETYSGVETTVLFPGDIARIELALNKMINLHHSAGCMALLEKDARRAKIEEKAYDEYCHLYERLIGRSPIAS